MAEENDHYGRQAYANLRCRICKCHLVDFDLNMWRIAREADFKIMLQKEYPSTISYHSFRGCLKCLTCFQHYEKDINPITRRMINMGGCDWKKLISSHKIQDHTCSHTLFKRKKRKEKEETKRRKMEEKKRLIEEKEMFQPTFLDKEIIHTLDFNMCNDVTGLIVSYLSQTAGGEKYDVKRLRKCDHFWCSQWTGCCMCSHPNDLCPSCKNHV